MADRKQVETLAATHKHSLISPPAQGGTYAERAETMRRRRTNFFISAAPTLKPTKEEEDLAKVEQAWSDCAHGFRTNTRWSWSPAGDTLHMQPLLSVHEYLEVYRAQFEAGDQSALLWAIRECARENLPLPYWCGDGFLQNMSRLESEPITLDEVFNIRSWLQPGKRGEGGRRSKKQATSLYAHVWQIHNKESHLSKDACIRRAREELKLHISQRKATDLFNAMERQQQPFRKALRMNWGRI